jgi:hypothetical protein
MAAATRLAGLAGLAATALLAACQNVGEPADPAVVTQTPPDSQTQLPEPTPGQTPDPADASSTLPEPETQPPANPVPHIYLSFQLDNTSTLVSAIFAIDVARDNTPSDDPAIRLSPEDGSCNPQEMRKYDFPPKDAAAPVVGDTEQAQGLTATDLPDFLAATVTEAMLNRGLAITREDTRALNICTRKLWESLVLAENR